MDPLEEWEVRETRGFVMRRGFCKPLERRRNPDAPKEHRGRNSFSRRACGHGCGPRCGMCKPGRHHGHGGAKARKKVHHWSGEREIWLDVLRDARLADQDFHVEEPRGGSQLNKQDSWQFSEVDRPLPAEALSKRKKTGRVVSLGDFWNRSCKCCSNPRCPSTFPTETSSELSSADVNDLAWAVL